jgi:hypothetical protein
MVYAYIWERHNGLPRSLRLCERCSQHCVEDERVSYMVFDCDAYMMSLYVIGIDRPLFDQCSNGDPQLTGLWYLPCWMQYG